MQQFLARHTDNIKAVLHGPDRIIFGGQQRQISLPQPLEAFLAVKGIRYENFASLAKSCSDQLVAHAQKVAAGAGRPYEYVGSYKTSKEELVDNIMKESPVKEGLVCVLRCTESVRSLRIAKTKSGPRFVMTDRRGLALYYYFEDREFGRMYVRIHTWWPFPIQIYINGRSYLAKQLARERIRFRQEDNCFTRIGDWERAQQLLDQLLQRKWARTLNALGERVNPLFTDGVLEGQREYYWTVMQSEHATDVLFRRPEYLQSFMKPFIRHAVDVFDSKDVLKFLGKKITVRTSDVSTHYANRAEGVRVKHRFGANSIKMYNKSKQLLRIETTVNDPYIWRIPRKDKPGLHQMRKGIADFYARDMVARAANNRYLDALAVVGDEAPTATALDTVCEPVRKSRRRHRPLHPTEPRDAAVLRLLASGAFAINGFRNRDIARVLDSASYDDPAEKKRLSGKVSRLIRLLRAHGLIRKKPKQFRYVLTPKGQRIAAASIAARAAPIADLRA